MKKRKVVNSRYKIKKKDRQGRRGEFNGGYDKHRRKEWGVGPKD